MMKSSKTAVVLAVACVALTACKIPGFGKKDPTGQVVATVGDREITVRELRAEMGAAQPADAKARKEQELSVLSNIVSRILLAKAAREQGVDKTPDFALAKDRVLDSLTVQAFQQKVVSEVPAPTKEEAQAFVSAHPDIFAERKIWVVDQIRMGRPSDPSLLKLLEPLKTLEDIEILLKSKNIPFQRGQGALDAVGADPRLVEAVVKFPPNEVFVIPGGPGLLINQIKQTKVEPFIGDPAINYAHNLMQRQRSQELLNRTFSAILTKEKGNVKFNKDYGPAQTPPGATAAPAPAKAP